MYKKFQLPWFIIFVSLALLAIVVTGCRKDQEITLPFEAIENADGSGLPGYYQEEEPKLVIVTTRAEADALGETISEDAAELLQKVDFSQVFAVVVFQGKKGTGYRVEIQRIIQKNDEIEIFTHFTNIEPEMVYNSTVTSPYHIVTIPKNGIQGEITFMLNVDGKVIIKQSYSIP